MREILFRGKTVDSGKWVEGSLILAEIFCCILEDENAVHPLDYPYLDGDNGVIDGGVTPIDPATIGQYTGITDKNGEKIFEGDEVRAVLPATKAQMEFTWPVMPVVFREGAFGLEDYRGDLIPFRNFSPRVEFEIVGNAHDAGVDE